MAQAQPFELRTDTSGDVYLKMDRLENIGLKNIGDLASYNMNRVGNRVMHHIEFANGGTLEVTLLIVGPNAAQVEVFKGQNLSLQRVGNDLIVGEMAMSPATKVAAGQGAPVETVAPITFSRGAS